ncbi:hypothetical protein [Loktanella sp. 5RATIMAR09]|uniref:hypothetical protein n=1 Tax=Loktanella sp. 5RATIMAR09 TaxID=1225655 RepID=UPI0006EB787D|nr:hypothetical protein [Loktanella sp. 5RATIMAR09]
MSIIEHVAYLLISMVTFASLLSRFGLEIVGLWVLVTALLNYAQIGDLWSKGLLSFIGQERGRGAPSDAAEYASTTIVTGAMGYLLAMSIGGAALYIFAPQLLPPHHVELVRHNIPLMVATYWLINSAGNFRLAFVGFGLVWVSAIQRIGGSLLFLLGVLALDPSSGLTGILTLQLFQGAVMLTFGVLAFYGFIARNIRYALWDRAKFRQLFSFGSKLFFVGSVELSIQPMIRLLCSQVGGLELVAVLEIVMRLIEGFRGMIISVGQVMVTSLARHHSSSQPEDKTVLRDNFVQATQVLMGGALIAFSLLFSAGPLISLLFLDADAQSGPGASFQIMLWMLGTAWFISTSAAAGYFLLMALRASRQLVLTVIIRAGLIALMGFPLGEAFGLCGVLATVLLAFTLSSAHLFVRVSKSVHLQCPQGLVDLLQSQSSTFIPFAWANALSILWIVSANLVGQPLMYAVYSVGFISTGLLVIRFGRVRWLLRTIMDLHA